ncbi:response regulator transcription factor [Endozoicomonas sp. Mp262]|uniref:response regulator n=1 Tax=Endozoicomonas sp. Mp262 TaxID=2919499 RepID=UPI0021D8CF4C
MKFLVVEDDDLLRHHIHYQLENSGHKTYVVPDAEEALDIPQQSEIDAAIIDLGLPGISGIELIRTLRQQGNGFPILILTARGNWENKVTGLEAGADDYMVKPFHIEELKARLNALVRRSSGFSQPYITAGPFTLDLSRKQVLAHQTPMTLTAYEYQILEYLMRHNQQVVNKQKLINILYENEGRDSNVLEVLIGRLRKKLEAAGNVSPIETVRGQGYLFNLYCT